MATEKVTVTIPEDLLEEIRAEATARGPSAHVTAALRARRDGDRLHEFVDALEEEHGPVGDEEHAAALRMLEEIDAEHERRRAEATPADRDA
ncbi:CopG family transcriptional regulator [Streptomyces sp. NPDC097619]|uniref:CopG family transcriptional regulator n=1 Tax=Streptomyces sp. NPDC097619 TaxID=3157228 RepID=UPI00332A92AA